VDTGVDEGDSISPWYDPMIAKLIVWAEDRPRALARLRRALADVRVTGVSTNAVFLSRLAQHEDFSTARLDTGLIARAEDTLLAPLPAPSDEDWQRAALAFVLHSRRRPGIDPWQADDGWRLTGHAPWRVELTASGEQRCVWVTCRDDHYQLHLDNEASLEVRAHLDLDELHLEHDGQRQHIGAVVEGDHIHLFTDTAHRTFERINPLRRRYEGTNHAGTLTAPMPGRIVALLVEPGAHIAQGTPLLVMEAMKMEHTLTAPHDGLINAFLVQPGELVTDGVVLVDVVLKEGAAVSS